MRRQLSTDRCKTAKLRWLAREMKGREKKEKVLQMPVITNGCRERRDEAGAKQRRISVAWARESESEYTPPRPAKKSRETPRTETLVRYAVIHTQKLITKFTYFFKLKDKRLLIT
jgi:hypothetical protein